MAYRNKNRNADKYPWTGQVVVFGKRKRKSFRSKKEALKWEAEQKQQQAEEPEVYGGTLLEWASKYMEFAQGEAGFVPKTFQEKRKAFKEFFKNIDPETNVESLNSMAYLLLNHFEKQSKQRSGYAANKDRKNLRAAWEWGIRYLQLPEPNPFHRMPRFRENREKRYMPPLDDFKKILEVTDTPQDKLMLRMYLETGARREELFRLQWKDVDFERNRVLLKYRKNQRGEWEEKWLPVRESFMAELKEHQKTTGLQKFVFLNMVNGTEDKNQWIPYQYRQHWLKNLCEKAGVRQFGFHGIR